MEPLPSTPKRKRLTRDQRRDVLLMRSLGKSYSEIAAFLKITERAVQYTCNTQKATPSKARRGPPSKLSEAEIDDLETFIQQSKDTRRMTYRELGDRFHVSADCIKRALRKRGSTTRTHNIAALGRNSGQQASKA